MKVYRVVMSFYDDDHDHGFYSSPLFETREAAEEFLRALRDVPEGDFRQWWTASGLGYGPEIAAIEEEEVFSNWDGVLAIAESYLKIT